MNDTLIRAGLALCLAGVAILLTVAAIEIERRRERDARHAATARRLDRLSVRDGYRYRPPRRVRGATAIGLLAAISKTRRTVK